MSVGMTVEIQLIWRDPNLIYENILAEKEQFDSFKVITKRDVDQIWLPMPDIIHDNAVIGKVN